MTIDFRTIIIGALMGLSSVLTTVGSCVSGTAGALGTVAVVATLGGCTDEKRVDLALTAVDKGAQVAERNGVEIDAEFRSDGLKFVAENEFRLSAGDLILKFKNNPLAPILYAMLEQNKAVTLALVAALENKTQ